jgi:hypothetical protein
VWLTHCSWSTRPSVLVSCRPVCMLNSYTRLVLTRALYVVRVSDQLTSSRSPTTHQQYLVLERVVSALPGLLLETLGTLET